MSMLVIGYIRQSRVLRVALSRTYRRGHGNGRKKLGRSFSLVFFCGILSVSRMIRIEKT